MNRIRPLALLGAATLTAGGLTVLATGTAQAADVNVARNGGFESGLAGWSCSAGSGAVVSSPVYAGAGALKATPAGSDNARCSQTVTVKPNS
ncbi:carbohydrate binding domain-containing protein, partial [Streptomyces goshikiensis]